MNDPTLFDPTPKRCIAPDCEAGTRKNLCAHDAALSHGDHVGKRPRSCLNSSQLTADQPLPF